MKKEALKEIKEKILKLKDSDAKKKILKDIEEKAANKTIVK